MKVLYIVILLILIIIIGWFFTYNAINNEASQLMDLSDEIIKSIEDGQWDKAKNQFEDIDSRWKQVRKFWTILLDHHEIDNIDLSIAKANKYINSKNKSLSLGEIEVLKSLFGIVKENEALTLHNIL